MKKNNKSLKLIDNLIKNYLNHSNDLLEPRHDMPEKYSKWDIETYLSLRNLLFFALTNESDFDSFYDRFDAPALAKGDKPIAWGPRFWPDLISDAIWSDDHINDRVKKIKKFYNKCIKLEKEFKKNKK